MEFTDVLGNIGILGKMLAYFLLQKGSIPPTGLWYVGLNLAGSLLLIISLLVHWNLPAFLLEAAWALISISGIVRHVYFPRMQGKP